MVFDAQYVFGPATRLQAQAIGEPGHRTFRLMVESGDGRAAALWVEKEQLQALGLAVEQLLAEFQGQLTGRPPRQPPAETFPPNPTVDFKVGRLALGQDESELETGPRYVLLVYDLEGSGSSEEETRATGDVRVPRHARSIARAEPQHRRGSGRRPPALPAVRRADGSATEVTRLRPRERASRLSS